jgi:hypothetical protein
VSADILHKRDDDVDDDDSINSGAAHAVVAFCCWVCFLHEF